ncbi:hypothetical protein sync_2752 [Synechococcus sp. CC9311]|nr:hypothetical protein sync_2752 [Synechococcus sp. CC9311]
MRSKRNADFLVEMLCSEATGLFVVDCEGEGEAF